MLRKNARLLLQLSRKLWVRVAGIAALSVIASLVAPLLGPVLPWEATDRFGIETTRPILNILASGMLVVTTFSLNVMVSAYRNAGGQATPRAYRLLLEDTTTQTVLATFTGAFIYALAALLLLNAGFYDGKAALVIFGFTVLVTVLIVVAILRWIDHLSDLGNMDHTMRTIEGRTATVLGTRQTAPALGAQPVPADRPLPDTGRPLPTERSGYVTFIDIDKLQEEMEATGGTFRILARPGDFIVLGDPLGYFTRPDPEDEDGDQASRDDALRKAFTIGELRSFDQDPRYGLMVLAEIGMRALSPGVNDPGTANEVVRRIERLLWDKGGVLDGPGADPEKAEEIARPNVEAAPFSATGLIEAGFGPVMRHAQSELDTLHHLVGAAARLSGHPDPEMAAAGADLLRELEARLETAPLPEIDRQRIASELAEVGARR